MTVAVTNASGSTVDEAELSRLVQFVLDEMGVTPQVELAVTLVDEAEMSRLHEQYMNEPGPTDVLAVPMDDLDLSQADETQTQLLGDVVVCPPVAEAQAREAGHDTKAELRLLCAHGVLHLLGFDHHEPDDEREMFGMQARLLASFAAVASP
ncbi:MAG: rRNA maturation RNase YbeY [Actinomycetes bacterium]